MNYHHICCCRPTFCLLPPASVYCRCWYMSCAYPDERYMDCCRPRWDDGCYAERSERGHRRHGCLPVCCRPERTCCG